MPALPPPLPSPRPPLFRFFFSVAAWLVSAWVCVLVVDWSFAPGVPLVLVPLVALFWVALGINVIVQAVRHGRGAPLGRKLLLASAFPVALFFQPLLMASAIGPPSEICLMTEFEQHRGEFERLGLLLERRAAPLVEAEPAGAPSPDALLSRLDLVPPRPAQPCGEEFVRWSGSSCGRSFEVGFLHSPVPPEDFRYSPDAVGPFRSHRALGGNWFIFRTRLLSLLSLSCSRPLCRLRSPSFSTHSSIG